MEFAQEDPRGALFDRPNSAATLSVWENAGALYQFVNKTLHAKIMKGAPNWFVPGDSGHLVCWWIPAGHRPDVIEGLHMWHRLQTEGESDNCFGTNGLQRLSAAPTA